jgi:hypothetical protein
MAVHPPAAVPSTSVSMACQLAEKGFSSGGAPKAVELVSK